MTNNSIPTYARERILAFGREGSGKTYSWLTIADALPNAPFYILDTDDTTQRMLAYEFSSAKNVEPILLQSWRDFDDEATGLLEEIDKNVKSNTPIDELPWIVVDMSDVTWDWVQAYFVEQVFDQGIDDFFLAARKGLGSKGRTLQPLEGWVDWQVINKIFQSRWNPLTRGSKYHLFLTAKTGDVNKDNKEMYSFLKTMPSGEKRMGHRMHTVLYFKKTRDDWMITSVKDRGRDLLDDEPIHEFVDDYLTKIAKWKI
jgi:hypothetical protein